MMIAYDDSTHEYYVLETQENVRTGVIHNSSSPFKSWNKGCILHFMTLFREYAYSVVYCLLLALPDPCTFSAFVVYYGKSESVTMEDHCTVEEALKRNEITGNILNDTNIISRAISLKGYYRAIDVGYTSESPHIWEGVYFISCYIFFFKVEFLTH